MLSEEGRYHHEHAEYANPWKGKMGRTKQIWIDGMNKYMKEHHITEELAYDRGAWQLVTNAGPVLHGIGYYCMLVCMK